MGKYLAGMMIAACAATAQAAPAISSGNHHSVALHADGTVRAWGDDSSGELGLGRTLLATAPSIVLGIADVAQVSSGLNFVIARRRDGTVWAWGENNVGQLGDGTNTNRSTPAPVQGLTGVIAVSAGNGHALALKADGTVWSWGENYRGQLGYEDYALVPLRVPIPVDIVEVAAGGGHSLALARDGTLWGWGGNDLGQLGDGTRTELYTGRTQPRPSLPIPALAHISAGNQHSAATTLSGFVYAWGRNDSGQVGNGTSDDRAVPVLIAGISGATQVSAGDDHTLVVINDGSMRAWGGGYSGQLGDGTGTPSVTPVRVAGLAGVQDTAAGIFFSVARTADGSVWAWGYNELGQLADGTTQSRLVPQRVSGLPGIASIAAGGFHAFAVALDGHVYAWGANDFGELGDGVRPLRSTPAVVPGASTIKRIAGGGTHTLAVKNDGTMLAWGANWAGQLGDGTTASRSVPRPVAALTGVAEITAGYYFSAALKGDGTVWTWGEGYQGVLGLGDETNASTPTQVPSLVGILAIASGGSHTLAVAADRTVRAWGANGAGELGDGTTIDRHSPVAVAGLADVKAVAAGAGHSLALKNDGTVWSWGENYSGELGDGTNTRHAVPARVPGLSGVRAIAAGDSFSLALKDDGTVVAWGANWDGQLGEGSGLEQVSPVPVSRLRDIALISAGGTGAMAMKSDGTVSAWGNNIDGRLGDGTFATRDQPVIVLREDGAGNLDTNDWFLDLDPSTHKTIDPDRIPVFLVVATNAAGETRASLRFRGQDIGTTASVFAFAIAPATTVKRFDAKSAVSFGSATKADGTKDDSVACVLAQLNGGELQQVSASSLQAYVSGVLASQGQSVTILNSGAAANAAGATFYVGYGASGTAMINAGLNRSALTVPGAATCQPQAPQTGWWWNPLEGGRGYSIEVQGHHIFFAAFHYDASGRATWNVASGETSLDGSLFTGSLLDVTGGQTLGGPYKPFANAAGIGAITLTFTDAAHGTMAWPGGLVSIERMPLVPGGVAAAPAPNQPESGWWWNASESGRGFFIEWQAGVADMAGYMYDDAGNPAWYISVYPTPDARRFDGQWWTYANGQSMGGAYKAPTQTSNHFAPVTVQFSAPDTALMTLPNGRTTTLTRQRF